MVGGVGEAAIGAFAMELFGLGFGRTLAGGFSRNNLAKAAPKIQLPCMWRYLMVACISGLAGYFLRGSWFSSPESVNAQWQSTQGQSRRVSPVRDTDSKEVVSAKRHQSVANQTRCALAELDPFKRALEWNHLLTSADVQTLAWMWAEVDKCHKEGLDTRVEGDLLQVREGQLLGQEGMKGLPSEPNGRPDYPILNRLKGWAMSDPVASGIWLEALEPGRTKESLQKQWLEALKEADPKQLLAAFQQFNPAAQSASAGRIIQGLVTNQGTAEAVAWFHEMNSTVTPEVKRTAFLALVDRATQSHDVDSSARAIQNAAGGDPILLYEGFSKLAWRSARFTPDQTLELLESFSTQSEVVQRAQPELLQKIFDWGSGTSINTFARWLNDHKSSPLYDRVACEFSIRAQRDDSESAKRWAATIKDPALRAETLHRLDQNK